MSELPRTIADAASAFRSGELTSADLVIAGLGTDTGGSIRGPSAFCGLSGIKQTFGLVSKEGCVPLGYSLDHIGPMAHTVWDCAAMLQVMAGYDPKDPCTVDRPVADMLGAMDGSLAGYDTDFLFLGTNFSGIWNVTGQPALCVPCGFAPTSGMPISMQIVGRPFDEPTVFKVGDAYQRMTEWHLRKPTPVWEAQPA